MPKPSPVNVTSLHGKTGKAIVHRFISAQYASTWLMKHYNRSPFNIAIINDRYCYTFDQADKVLHSLSK